MNIELIEVTPQMAKEWLATNAKNNRDLSKITVKRYATDMVKGKWLLTGEAVKFDRTGRLIDGQHRLQALIESKVPKVNMFVVRGLDAETMAVLDTGRSRSAGDALKIGGHNGSSNEKAALARRIIAYNGGQSKVFDQKKIRLAGTPITNREILDYVNENDLEEHVRFAHRARYHSVTQLLNVGEWAFLHWLFSQRNPADATAFLEKLATLEDVKNNSPIRTLFDKMTKSSIKLDGKMKLAAAAQAWNAYRQGDDLKKIHVGRAEECTIPELI